MEVKNMTKKEDSVLRTKTRRQFLSIGHYTVLEKMKEKSRRYGSKILIVGERYTSKTCGRCGLINRELKGEETYKCNKCGLVIDRDINGARNILLRTIGEMTLR
jgi:putative transposase